MRRTPIPHRRGSFPKPMMQTQPPVNRFPTPSAPRKPVPHFVPRPRKTTMHVQRRRHTAGCLPTAPPTPWDRPPPRHQDPIPSLGPAATQFLAQVNGGKLPSSYTLCLQARPLPPLGEEPPNRSRRTRQHPRPPRRAAAGGHAHVAGRRPMRRAGVTTEELRGPV